MRVLDNRTHSATIQPYPVEYGLSLLSPQSSGFVIRLPDRSQKDLELKPLFPFLNGPLGSDDLPTFGALSSFQGANSARV